MARRYAHHFQDEPGPDFTGLEAGAFNEEQSRLHGARALLAAVQPALHAELDTLTPEIVLVGNPGGLAGYVFHGASSFYVWGALALNAAEHKTRVDLLQGLVHEAGHGLLHGLTLGGGACLQRPREPVCLAFARRPAADGGARPRRLCARPHASCDARRRPVGHRFGSGAGGGAWQ